MPWRKGRKLKMVPEREATGKTLEIYRQIKRALGVPHVSVIFQVYGAYPRFLELHWQAFQPVVETQGFFVLGERLRADGYTRMHNYFKVPDLRTRMAEAHLSPGAREELADVVELFHYVNPLLLLLVAAQHQAFGRRIGELQTVHAPEHPVFVGNPLLVEEEASPPEVKEIYDDIHRTLGLPILSTTYLALARWPDFLETYWSVLKQVVESPVYNESMHGVRETAWGLVRELPYPVELTVSQLRDADIGDDDVAALVRITETIVNILSGLVLNIALAKIGLEGGNLGRPQAPPIEAVPQHAA
jgi:hypothetical protein